MKHLVFCFGVIIAILSGHAHGLQTPAQAAKADEVLKKMRQVDLLTQMIPLLLDKAQINKMLPSVERARARVTAQKKAEAEALDKVDSKITAEVQKSIDTGVPPSKDFLQDLAQMTARFSATRNTIADENTAAVLKVFKETLNAGQLKAAANSLAPQLFDPSLKPDQMTQDDKLRFFIREIFLDPQAYDILVRLAAK
jgi:hypothetical protein